MTGLLRRAAGGISRIARPRDWAVMPWPWRVLHVTARALGVTAAVAVIWWGANAIVTNDDACQRQGATYVMHEGTAGECVGVTDGSYLFNAQDPALTAIEGKIHHENQWVTKHRGDYVSVAYLMPFPTGASAQSPLTLTEQLEGAYTAQYYANRHNVDGTAPLIQLLIANDGNNAGQWQATVTDIVRDQASQHLVAVAGLGVSLNTTLSAAKALTRDQIPVIGTVTSDDFSNIPNMVRVAPSNQDAVSAALSFISKASTVMLIEDNNPDDNYDKTLVSAFTSGLRPNAILGPHIYSTQNGDGPDVQTRIAQMALEICSAKADDVVFAGRGKDLATLLSALATRDCRNKVTIITGNDVTNMRVKPPVGYSLATGVTVEYAGVASPGEWPSGTDGFTRFRQAFTQLFPHVPYDDGTAMIGYDAAFTATSAIRLTTKADPEPAEVIQELGALQGTRKVPGASGVIDFNANYANGHGSNPIGKPVPILRLLPNGAIGFVHLEWPNGHPPAG